MRRRIFLWMGLSVLFLSLGFSQEAFATISYKVKSGDTLTKISKKFGISTEALKEANQLSENILKPKQILMIPPKGQKKTARSQATSPEKARTYAVKKGDTLSSISRKTGVSITELQKANHIRGSILKPGQKLALAKVGMKRGVVAEETVETRKADALLEDDLEDDDDLASGENDLAIIDQDSDASSHLLGQWNNPDEQKMLVKVVKGFLGTPYRLGGSTVRGIDCSGFVVKIYEFFDVSLPRTAREQSQVGMKVSREELEVGDLVFFNTRRAFGHVGIYIGNNEFIHAAAGRRNRAVRIDSLDKPHYNKRFIKAVRLKGTDDQV
jgi:LysM repeat protein